MKVIRIMAQLIDLIMGFAAMVISFLAIPPVLSRSGAGPVISGIAIFAGFILLAAGLQYPFMKNGQSIGKAFFGLTVVTSVPERPLTVSILFQREIFLKLFTCYFICIPVLFNQPGGHEAATQTKIERNQRGRKA